MSHNVDIDPYRIRPELAEIKEDTYPNMNPKKKYEQIRTIKRKMGT